MILLLSIAPVLSLLAPYYSSDHFPNTTHSQIFVSGFAVGDQKKDALKFWTFFLIIVSRFGQHVIIMALTTG